MKKIIFVWIALIGFCATSFATEFTVGIIKYNTTSATTVEVVSNSYSGAIVIPDSVTYNSLSYAVTAIGEMAFMFCTGVTSVSIPNSVTEIGGSAFYYCRGLTSIIIPDSVTVIGNYAFESCSGLTSITIPNSVTAIGTYTFALCSALTAISVDDENTVYSSDIGVLFDKNKTVLICCPAGKTGNYTIPNSVTSIDDYAFAGCSGLTSIHVDSGNTIYSSENGVLFTKTKTELICCPAGKIGTYSIPNSVTTIGEGSFFACLDLISITIPNSVTMIGDYAFQDCSGLISIIIGNSVTTIGKGAFYDCSSLTSVIIPDSVTTIGDESFYRCTDLISVIIGNSVTMIGDNAFWYCSGLTSISIPNTVTSIGYDAFFECSGLQELYIKAVNPPAIVSNYTFYNVPDTIPVYVPCGSVDAYKNAPRWNSFSNIMEYSSFDVKLQSNDPTMGRVNVLQAVCATNTIIFEAVANTGYNFEQWDDGNTDNPRQVILTQDTTFTALFGFNSFYYYIVTVLLNDSEMGMVDGDGVYEENTIVTLTAIANTDYAFENWTCNGIVLSTDNPFAFTVTNDTNIVANFKSTTGISETTTSSGIVLYPNPVEDILHIQSSATIEQVTIYDMSGRMLRQVQMTNDIPVQDLATGVYVIKIQTKKGIEIRKIVKE
jgi:hypothetical protein